MRQEKEISVIVPARNEEAQIESTLRHVLAAVATAVGTGRDAVDLGKTPFEVIVVDNASTDGTRRRIEKCVRTSGVQCVGLQALGAPQARNGGAAAARGRVLVFVDADTQIPPDGLLAVRAHVASGKQAGIFRLACPPRRATLRGVVWWAFWNHVRLLPLARAKAMPAFMFCTRDAFDRHGPFDETVAIGEEWPILVGVYRASRRLLVYDRRTTACTSGRRMERQRFGYLRTYLKYAMAILFPAARVRYTDRIREIPAAD